MVAKRQIAFWIFLSLALALGGWFTGMQTVLPGPSSKQAIAENQGEAIATSAGIPLHDTVLLQLIGSGVKVEDPSFVSAREDLFQTLKNSATAGEPMFLSLQTVGHTWLEPGAFVAADAKSVLIIGETSFPRWSSSKRLLELPRIVEQWRLRFPGFKTYYLSSGTADNEMFELINNDLDRSLWITLPLTLFILLLSFGSLFAAAIPLLVGLVSLLASLGAAAILSTLVSPVSATAAQLVVLLVLAIGVDYSLFFVSRMREEAAKSDDRETNANIAIANVRPAIFWSGVTVALSLGGLLLMRDTVLTSMAHAAICSVLITLAGIMLAVPAIIRLYAVRLGEVTSFRRLHIARGLQSRLVRLSLNRPAIVLTIAITTLGLISAQCFNMRLGSTVQPDTLPRSMQSAVAFQALRAGFPNLAGPDFSLVLSSPELEQIEAEGSLQPFFDAIAERKSLGYPLSVDRSDDGTVARYHFRARGSTNDAVNIESIETIKTKLIPQLLTPLEVKAWLSGTLPFAVEELERYSDRFLQVVAAVLGLSFVFLLVAFRSLAIPLKALLLNLLSATTSFGVLVLVFQDSLSPWNYGVVESFVPALLFSILFGLSMDYHVFLLSRIKEERDRGAKLFDAVRIGIESTSATITSAALIMAAVFLAIASLELPVMKQLGTGLAIAVLLDATVVRSMLLPASMVLLGKWNWYLPGWLRWIPQVRIH